jgi:hypothetical protein
MTPRHLQCQQQDPYSHQQQRSLLLAGHHQGLQNHSSTAAGTASMAEAGQGTSLPYCLHCQGPKLQYRQRPSIGQPQPLPKS